MKKIEIDELLQLQLDILKSVDEYCRRNDIKYFLTSGTCIGAVRHGGYIPWDDDIDIGMTRPHYERFVREFNQDKKKNQSLRVFAPELNWNYYAPYANVCDVRTILDEGANGHRADEIGVKIDVFPIDGIPSEIDEYRREKKEITRLWNILYYKRRKLSGLHNKIKLTKSIVRKLQYSCYTYESIQKKFRDVALSNNYEDSKYAIDVVFPWGRDVMCEKEVYEDLIETKFENIDVFIMRNYDRYLSLKYGDYMQLPPVEQRRPHHDFIAYWKD